MVLTLACWTESSRSQAPAYLKISYSPLNIESTVCDTAVSLKCFAETIAEDKFRPIVLKLKQGPFKKVMAASGVPVSKDTINSWCKQLNIARALASWRAASKLADVPLASLQSARVILACR